MALPDGVKRFGAQTVKPKSEGGGNAPILSSGAKSDSNKMPSTVRTFDGGANRGAKAAQTKVGAAFKASAGNTSKAKVPGIDASAGKGKGAAQDGSKGKLNPPT